uniref:Ras-GEF domain-containing protein n=1 Tax=Macrostomum lignano TaxID=282301 RepID=A0A1I8FAL6_9PLAT
MRIIHGTGYTDDDKRSFIKIIYQNIYMAMHAMTRAIETLRIPFEDSSTPKCLREIIDYETPTTLTPFAAWWADAGMKECYDRRRNSANRFGYSTTWIAWTASVRPITCQHCRTSCALVCHYRHCGATRFDLDSIILRMRQKVDPLLSRNVTSIMFLVARSCPNTTRCLVESDNERNQRMEESKALFRTIITYHLTDFPAEFDGASARRQRRASESSYSKCYPDKIIYSHFTCATAGEAKSLCTFSLSNMHTLSGPDSNPRDSVPPLTHALFRDHLTAPPRISLTKTDTENIRFVFAAVKDTILQLNLKEYNL